MADKLLDAAPVNHSLAPVTNSPTTSSSEVTGDLRQQIHELTAEIRRLKFNRSRSQSRSRNNYQSRYRSPSPDICYYHRRFRRKARKCQSPCRFTGQVQQSEKRESQSLEAASDPGPKPQRRLFIFDRSNAYNFLIDTGADINVLPAKNKVYNAPAEFKLYAANGTTINTYGERTLQIDLGLRRTFK
ncbi:uncharacterized protein LOC123301404 [Chrysoperla carnea]|uniref:uncharacterized protein LOC123301404 n=1 Tax=Chrysoperla carnea TaxID=189513 RepID=UPI001D072805|nr:uncharacterized protein LOC123301404 [Chrysoperla carnea]